MHTSLSTTDLRQVVGDYVMSGRLPADHTLIRECIDDLGEHARATGDLDLAIIARCAEARAEQILEEYIEAQSRRRFGHPTPGAIQDAIEILNDKERYKGVTSAAIAKSTNEASFLR